MSRLVRWLPHFTAVALVALLGSLVPATPVAARKVTRSQAIDDTLNQFAEGTLQRTALAPIGVTPDTPDQGGLQLSPLAYIERWDESANALNECVTSHGAAALKGNLYIIGGLTTPDAPTCTSKQTTISPHTWRAPIGGDGNVLSDWVADSNSDLPAPTGTPVNGLIPCTRAAAPKAGRSSVAVASYDAGSAGYLYALGGSLDAQISNQVLSTASVMIATTDASGVITGWRQAASCLPQELEAASATTIEIQGSTYLYVVGGLRRFRAAGATQLRGLRTTYFAKLNPSTGEPEKVSDPGVAGWDTATNDLPIPEASGNSDAGLWNASASSYISQGSGVTSYTLFVAGGEKVPGSSTFNSAVFRATIAADTKNVTWNTNGFSASFLSPRTGTRGIQFNGNLIYIGGRTGSLDSTLLSSVQTNQVDDNLNLTTDTAASFYDSPQTFPRPRYNHASVVSTVNGKTYVYVLGGQGRANPDQEDTATATLFYGRVDSSSDSLGYALSGWYFSKPRRLVVDNGRLLAVSWNAQINRSASPMDIKLEYRITSDPTLTEGNWSTWKPISDTVAAATGHSTKDGTGLNKSDVESLSALYFQYRAYFTTTKPSGGAAWATPALESVNIEIEVPGHPNLQVASGAVNLTATGGAESISVTIANQNPLPVPDPLQPVDAYGTGGTFFVDLYIFQPGETPVAPTLGQLGQVYNEVDKRVFPQATNPPYDGTYNLTKWCRSSVATCDTAQAVNIAELFPVVGTYTVYAMVDSTDSVSGQPYANVEEADDPGTNGELDNVLQFTVTVTCVSNCVVITPTVPPVITPTPGTTTPTIYLPVITK